MTQTSSSMTKVTLTPKGINRVGSIFSDTVSRCKSPFILYIIAMVIFGPLAAIIDYVSMMSNERNPTSWDGSQMLILCVLIFLGASVVIPMVVFSYLDNRRALDVFHALPVTRGKMYGGNLGAALFLLYAPFVVCVLPVATAIDCSPFWLQPDPVKRGTVPFDFLQTMAVVAATGLLLFALMTLLMICCSTIVESFGYFCILLLGYTSVVYMGFHLVGNYTFGYTSFWPEQFLMRFTPISFLLSGMNIGRGTMELWYYVAQVSLLGIALLVIAWRRLTARKSEQAGGYIWAPVYYTAAIFASITAGFYIKEVFGSGNTGVDVVGAGVTAVLVYIVLDSIRHRGFRQITRSVVTSVAGVAGFAVVALVIGFTGTFGYESWVPKTEDVLAVKVDSRGLSADVDFLSSAFPLYDSGSIQTVIDFHHSIVDNQQPLEDDSPQPLVEYDPYGFANGDEIDRRYGYVSVDLTYEMKNGREVTRSYTVPAVMTKPLYELSGTKAYSCAIADQFDAYAESLQQSALGDEPTLVASTAPASSEYDWHLQQDNGVWYYSFELNEPGLLYMTSNSSVGVSLTRDEAVDFFNGLAADLRRRPDASERELSDQPVMALNLSSMGFSNTMRWLYIYDSDTDTLQFLEQRGYYSEADGLATVGNTDLYDTFMAVIPAETSERVHNLSFYFSGTYFENGGFEESTTSEVTADGREGILQLYDDSWDEESGDEDYGLIAEEHVIKIDGMFRNLSDTEIEELASLIYIVGYSDEPMDLLFIGGDSYFIPEENVERVNEIVYGR